MRGLNQAEAQKLLPEARALYLKVLASPQAIVIDTFHGWFGRLLGAAPVSADVQPGFNLREDSNRLQEECMEDWWGDLPQELKEYFDILLAEFGASETQKFLMGNYSLFKQRGAWTFFLDACRAKGMSPVDHLKACLSHLGKPNPLELFWKDPQTKANLPILYQCFNNGTPTQKAKVALIEKAMELNHAGGSIMDIAHEWQSLFITKEKTPLADIAKMSAPMTSYHSKNGIDPTIITGIRNDWVEAFDTFFAWESEHLMHEMNVAWFAMSEAMLSHLEKVKESMQAKA